jgi:predicted glycoside hydrolase/deacetylase ChbG (UPF0249 family)
MRIILNADDFGQNDDTVAATIECFERGALSSATIMPKMPATPRAVAFAKEHPQFSFGVHLTYVRESDGTPESPICSTAEVPGLVDADGRFLPSNLVRSRALLGRIPVDQIERETAAQIESLLERGIPVSHVDSHGHLHKFKPFRQALERVLPRLGIRRVRSVQDVYLTRPLKSPTFWFGPLWRAKLRRRFEAPEHFFMPDSLADRDWPTALLARLKGASLEVGVHPGYQEAWRAADRAAVQDFTGRAKAAGHEIIGWKDL